MCYCLLFLVSTLRAPAQCYVPLASSGLHVVAIIILCTHVNSSMFARWNCAHDGENRFAKRLILTTSLQKPPDSRPHCDAHAAFYYNWLLWLRYRRQDTTSVVNKNDVVVVVVGVLLLPFFFSSSFIVILCLALFFPLAVALLPVSSTRRRCFVVVVFSHFIFLFFAFAFLFVCSFWYFDFASATLSNILIIWIRVEWLSMRARVCSSSSSQFNEPNAHTGLRSSSSSWAHTFEMHAAFYKAYVYHYYYYYY